jgi:hypothetical protein
VAEHIKGAEAAILGTIGDVPPTADEAPHPR